MTIKKTNGIVTASDIGKFAHLSPMITDTICGRAWLITDLNKTRVYLTLDQTRTLDRESGLLDIEHRFVSAKTVVYITDTLEDSKQLMALSEAQHRELLETRKNILKNYENRLLGITSTGLALGE
jgi:hypothetical protein